MYIFISHSSKNADVAQSLCNIIEANGSECFLAPRDIRSGFEYASEIINGIDRSDVMLLILSNDANTSPHILREIERAVSKSIPIIVYKIEEVVLTKSMEYFLMTHQWLNAENGTHQQLLTCIDQLRARKAYAAGAAYSQHTPNSNYNTTPMDITNNITNNVTTKRAGNKSLPIVIGAAVGISVAVILSLILVLTLSGNKTNENTTTGSHVAENTSEEDSSEQSSTDETSTEYTTKPSIDNSDIELGDTIVFGRYNDADIHWKVIKISDDGTEAVLIARNLLTFKSFSAAESGKCHFDGNKSYIGSGSEVLNEDLELQAYVKGNSDWSSSTIRTWLNSDSDYVDYKGAIPTNLAMSDGKNGYNSEPGFLYNFSDDELAAIKETTVQTKGNALSDEEVITTTDRVFLLSIDELEWLKEANVSLYVAPTAEAIAKNKSPWYREQCLVYTDACIWWLRDSVEGKSSQCYAVSFSNITPELYSPYTVAVEDFGIRPAITVDLTSDCIKVEK